MVPSKAASIQNKLNSVYFISRSFNIMGKKDESKPRGRMSSYAFFVQTCREEHKKKHPNDTVVFTEFTKKCAEKWKVCLQLYIFVCVEKSMPSGII